MIRKTLSGLGLAGLVAFTSSQAFAAINFEFYGEDSGGVGSATMTVNLLGSPSGNQVTVSLDNTSPTTLNNGNGTNSPGIAGFGLDFTPDRSLSDLLGWSLYALDSSDNQVLVGSNSCAACDWIMSTTQAGVTFDFLPQVQTGTDGLLFNPDAVSGLPGGQNSTYFTTALLTLDFKSGLGVTSVNKAYVRMQNVGRNGAGSLKLYDDTPTNGGGGGNGVPEPGSLGLVGLALAGLTARTRRKARD